MFRRCVALHFRAQVVVGAQLGAKLPAAPDDDGEWVVDAAVLDAKSRDNAAAADVVVVEIARSRAAAPRGRRHRGVAPQHDVRRDQFFSYIDHDDDCHDDQLSQWCAVEDALLERALQANERRRREKNWMERDW